MAHMLKAARLVSPVESGLGVECRPSCMQGKRSLCPTPHSLHFETVFHYEQFPVSRKVETVG